MPPQPIARRAATLRGPHVAAGESPGHIADRGIHLTLRFRQIEERLAHLVVGRHREGEPSGCLIHTGHHVEQLRPQIAQVVAGGRRPMEVGELVDPLDRHPPLPLEVGKQQFGGAHPDLPSWIN